MTNTERIQALMRFGYTEREAAFICLVALSGGFFLRRQYCEFAKAGDGGTVTAFIEKLLRNEHGRMVTGFGNLRVHHIFARPIYNAIGQENSRNRRERATVAMKNKLMGLDFVLGHPGNTYLMTEQEKFCYFTSTLGIAITDLPVKEFRSPTAEDSTSRYFIDKYPIFLPLTAGEIPSVSFTFIDEGIVTSSRFETYLRQYERLFARLARFAIVYVATSDQPFGSAEKAFESFLSGGGRHYLDRLRVADPKRLAEYFARQHLSETKQFDSWKTADFIQLRNYREEFSGPFYKALYNRWKVLGDQAFQDVFGNRQPVIDPSHACFTTCLLPHNYDIFGK
ncbi:MAG: hypothetical protein LAO55_17460 [Acidobacteriia bacterium]|nr:hypothetical protein [Terriglobia bacterium]